VGWDVEKREASDLVLACATGNINQKFGAIAMVASKKSEETSSLKGTNTSYGSKESRARN
jgi:hypothetical protein